MKIIIADPKTGKTYQKEIAKEMENNVVGKKIGDQVDGNLLGLAGYTLELTGGSDKSGFPMREDVKGQRKSHSLLSDGPGFNPTRKGERRRKLIRGNTYSIDIMQVNMKIINGQGQPLDQLFPKKEEKK